MKTWIWLVFAAIILLTVVFFASESVDDNFFGNYGNSGKNADNNNNGIINYNDSASQVNLSSNIGGSSNSGGSGSGGAESGGANTENKEENLPEDIDDLECGFYYSEYGVCSGTCPSGTCVSEGRSCYCKKN